MQCTYTTYTTIQLHQVTWHVDNHIKAVYSNTIVLILLMTAMKKINNLNKKGKGSFLIVIATQLFKCKNVSNYVQFLTISNTSILVSDRRHSTK